MARLIITGDSKQLGIIAKTEKGRANKYGLEISLEEDKQDGATPPANSKTANEIAEIIAKIESIEDLRQYETDGRQTVVAAYKKKLKELE